MPGKYPSQVGDPMGGKKQGNEKFKKPTGATKQGPPTATQPKGGAATRRKAF